MISYFSKSKVNVWKLLRNTIIDAMKVYVALKVRTVESKYLSLLMYRIKTVKNFPCKTKTVLIILWFESSRCIYFIQTSPFSKIVLFLLKVIQVTIVFQRKRRLLCDNFYMFLLDALNVISVMYYISFVLQNNVHVYNINITNVTGVVCIVQYFYQGTTNLFPS
jgi:hypothetical protein